MTLNKQKLMMGMVMLLPWFTACQEKQEQAVQVASYADFDGCYTISYDEPAQIKISKQQDKWVMQMKEGVGKRTVWDKPEPLDELKVSQGWEFFKVNMLDLDKKDVQAIIARADGMLALAKVHDAAKNTNPRLDSEYVVFIAQGSNTIYKVACDDKPVNF